MKLKDLLVLSRNTKNIWKASLLRIFADIIMFKLHDYTLVFHFPSVILLDKILSFKGVHSFSTLSLEVATFPL